MGLEVLVANLSTFVHDAAWLLIGFAVMSLVLLAVSAAVILYVLKFAVRALRLLKSSAPVKNVQDLA